MEEEIQDYKMSYDIFMEKYKQNTENAISVGEEIARQSQFFTNHNLKKALYGKILNKKAAENILTIDDVTKKQITSAKAETIIQGTDEFFNYYLEKTNVENIEQNINSLKSLQKSLLFEIGSAGL